DGDAVGRPADGRAGQPPAARWLTPGDGGKDRDLLAVRHRGLDALAEADVVPGHEHVDEAAQAAVLHDPLTEAGVPGVDLVDQVADGPRGALEGRGAAHQRSKRRR